MTVSHTNNVVPRSLFSRRTQRCSRRFAIATMLFRIGLIQPTQHISGSGGDVDNMNMNMTCVHRIDREEMINRRPPYLYLRSNDVIFLNEYIQCIHSWPKECILLDQKTWFAVDERRGICHLHAMALYHSHSHSHGHAAASLWAAVNDMTIVDGSRRNKTPCGPLDTSHWRRRLYAIF